MCCNLKTVCSAAAVAPLQRDAKRVRFREQPPEPNSHLLPTESLKPGARNAQLGAFCNRCEPYLLISAPSTVGAPGFAAVKARSVLC